THANRTASKSSKRRAARSKSRQHACVTKPAAKPIVFEPESSEGEDTIQWTGNEQYQIYSQETRPLFPVPSSESDIDSDSDKENAGPGVGADDPFAVDPEERAEAERFLKEQERLQERRRLKLGASPTVNQLASTHTLDSLDLGAINARLNARNATRQLSFDDDVPSCQSREILSAAKRDHIPDGKGDRDELQAQQFDERDWSDRRLSVSTFGSGSSRSTFYRD
ncbi:hypothetical protein AAVH_40644, partial [Aphelenchoides avenae]